MRSSSKINYPLPKFDSLEIYEYLNDIPLDLLNKLEKSKRISWDIETTGLDWKLDQIGTCQLFSEDNFVVIIKITEKQPERLKYLLSCRHISKIFHYAMFDLRFMSYKWNCYPQNIVCTKIASKLLRRGDNNGLKTLLKEYLNINISKRENLRKSNWLANNLSNRQKEYAAMDVLYLPILIDHLQRELFDRNLLRLANECFSNIPTQLELEINEYKGIYNY